jgi:hypothetical protein
MSKTSVKISTANNDNTPPEVLAQLAKDADNLVKREVTGNTNTQPKSLAQEALLEEYPQFKNEIEEFSRNDPSGRLKYLKWQVNILNSGQAKPLEIQEVTDLFHRLGKNLKNTGLYSYKPSDFTDLPYKCLFYFC